MKFEGQLTLGSQNIAIVTARFNDLVTTKLFEGAKNTLIRHGLNEENIDEVWVPGAFEIPLACQNIAQTNKYQAIIALGAVIRGSTPHFDYVCSEVAKGISKVSLDHNIPVAFGVLTTDSVDQALDRAGLKVGNKGVDAALSAIEMISLLSKIKESH